MNDRQLVMYSRTLGCPFVTIAKNTLNQHDISYEEILIDLDDEARMWLLNTVGFLSVPTLVIARNGSILPFEEPDYLKRGESPRGINRGSVLTEPSEEQLLEWLQQHQIITFTE